MTQLRDLGIRSVMVEGGAEVIKSFLVAANAYDQAGVEGSARTWVDSLIITAAPTIVGEDGIDYASGLTASRVRQDSIG